MPHGDPVASQRRIAIPSRVEMSTLVEAIEPSPFKW